MVEITNGKRRPPRFLHIVPDDKFIPFVQCLYATAYPNQNQFRVLGVDNRRRLRFVTPEPNVKVVSDNYWFSSQMKDDLNWCDCLLVHYMTPQAGRVILSAPENVTVVWMAWGGDFYHLLPAYSEDMYLPDTRAIVSELRSKGNNKAVSLPALIKKWIRTAVFRNWEQRAIARVDLASMLEDEHRALGKAFQGFRAEHFHFNWYYSAENIFSKGGSTIVGPDILVGNSATPTGNHVEVFDLLESSDLEGRKIIVPLSYGDDAYADEITRIGEKRFGERFVPLRTYLPIDEYNDIIASCGTVFMNHIRQQAFGNICTALFKGAKVFLRAQNPIFSFLKDKGAILYEMPKTPAAGCDWFEPLGPGDVETNREILLSFLSFERVVEQVKVLEKKVAERRGIEFV